MKPNLLPLIALAIFYSSAALAVNKQETCTTPTFRCECFQQVPFEAYTSYVVETCNGQEQWYILDRRQYSKEDCEASLLNDETCKSLTP